MYTFGYDYGIKPIMMIVGDTEFASFLGSDEFVALAYDQVPEFGLLVNPPRLSLVFSNGEAARKCFAHFKNWSGESGDGDAVRISFVEFNDGGYGICISQEVDRLTNRMVPEILREEVELIIMNAGRMKTFPQRSEAYKWFKSATEKVPFVLAPKTVEDFPIRELAIRKREIYYFQEDNIPEHSLEDLLVRGKNSKEEQETNREIPEESKLGRDGIYKRRQAQLSRFFPVTLERLSFNKPFLQTKAQLVGEGYQEWQITQAACNIALKHNVPELFTTVSNTSDSDEEQINSVTFNVLEFLLANHEDLSRTLPPNTQLSTVNLKVQIQADSFELLKYVAKSHCKDITPNELQSKLGGYELLIK